MTDQTREPKWHGIYLDEDAIVADVVKKVKADAEGVKRWLDPRSWRMPDFSDPGSLGHAGSLVFAGMAIRNYYGMWHDENPHTVFDETAKVENGVITDGRHPDNFSGRIIDRVKALLSEFGPAETAQ